METSSGEDEGSGRDNNVDLNDEHMEGHMAMQVAAHLGRQDNHLTAFHQLNNNNSEPFLGMEFESEEAAKLFYMAYASRVGFSVRISKSRRSRNDESIIMRRFVCSKEGFHLKKGNFDDTKKKRKRATIREGCNAMIEVIQKYYGRWVVTKLVKEHNHAVAAPNRVVFIAPEEYAGVEPYLGMEFQSHEAAQTFYYAYASRMGFDVRIRLSRRSTRDESFVMRRFVCTKEGVSPYEENFDENKKKRSRTLIREGCKAMLEVIKKDYNRWIVSKLVTEHTHELAVAPGKVHYIQSQSEVVVLAKSGSINREKSAAPSNLKLPSVETTVGFDGFPSSNLDFRNDAKEDRQYSFGAEDTHSLLEYFKRMQAENSSFYYVYQLDKNNSLVNVFWADSKARMSYYCFGDAVTFDTTYKDDKNMMPFVMFTGVNHHLQSVFFGCALLTDDSETSFIWLFENWLMAMGQRPPLSLLTDLHEVMGAAISKVFPDTRHRFCRWHILRKCKDRLSTLYLTRHTFGDDLEKCVNQSETVEMFESGWKFICDKYELGENSWMQYLYAIRQKWVPVYLKDTFTAEISATQRPESMHKFFDMYFNANTTLLVFASLFEQATMGWYGKEFLEDLASFNTKPILRTPSNMLKQVAEIYTRAVFDIFQEEFIESLGYNVDKVEDDLISRYTVTKDEDVHTTCIVTHNPSTRKSECSCCKFETCGILCRHILRVFLTIDVRVLPEFYIIKRWTRDAKSGFEYDECARYNELCREAIQFAREGSQSHVIYNVAKRALEMACGEVAAKKNLINQCPL